MRRAEPICRTFVGAEIMTRRYMALLVLVLLTSPAAAIANPANPIWRDSSPWSTERAYVTIGDQVIEAEIADTSPLQVRGLSYRESLLPGTGMLFKFEQ